MKDLTSSVYTFENLIQGNFLYVDKTEYLWNLVRPTKSMYFLSRPRRFGKSLTLSTLKAIFQGRKELFEGLAIYDKPYDWKPYPVIHLSFGDYSIVSNALQELPSYLKYKIHKIANSFSLTLSESSPALCFGELIDQLAEKSPVVVLVDEYDKPILDNITNPDIHNIQKCLKGFYSVLKDRNSLERFVFITGVSKFSHVSLFSDLNNLMDITMNVAYATMLGYTQAEFENNFKDWIAEAELRQSLSHADYVLKIKEWYDGYTFHTQTESVYNPVSLANFFLNNGEFGNYWFATGTPTFLLELIKKKRLDLEQALAEPASSYIFETFEIDDIPPMPLLLQTGYLTIKSSETKREKTYYRLDFPNREVSESFNVHLLNAYVKRSRNEVATFCDHLADAMVENDLLKFQETLEVFFSGIPYDVHHKDEVNFQNIFYAIFKLLGYDIHAESRTSDGRIDAIVETEEHIYLFEFKLDADDSALSQIKEKEYFKPYLLLRKKITLVGVNLDTNTGKLSNWKNEDVS